MFLEYRNGDSGLGGNEIEENTHFQVMAHWDMLHPVVAKDAPQWQTERTIDQTRGKQKNKVRLRLCTNGETASPYVHCPSIQLPGHPDR